MWVIILINDKIQFSDKELCCFMYRVNYHHRVEIFNKFSAKMKVDSYGESCNNMKNISTRTVYNNNETYNDITVNIYSNYKFILAIENVKKDYYSTEKIINPILANSIPVYYGSNTIFKVINKKRVIYFDDYDNIDTLIDYIIYLSNNKDEYDKIISKSIFNSKSKINLGFY